MEMTRRTPAGTGLAVLTAIALTLTACATSVNQILSDPSRYRDREVTVSGRVSESFSLGERGVYRVSDHTGDIWVASDRGVPRNGAHVKVTGTIREGFNLGSFGLRIALPAGVGSGLVLVERSHRADD